MHFLDLLRPRPDGDPHVECSVSAAGVQPGFARRLVPLADVDHFDVRPLPLTTGEAEFGWLVRKHGDRRHPAEELVLLTHTGRTIVIPTSAHHSLGRVAERLNGEVLVLRGDGGPGGPNPPP